jgi:hypothetical protein
MGTAGSAQTFPEAGAKEQQMQRQASSKLNTDKSSREEDPLNKQRARLESARKDSAREGTPSPEHEGSTAIQSPTPSTPAPPDTAADAQDDLDAEPSQKATPVEAASGRESPR